METWVLPERKKGRLAHGEWETWREKSGIGERSARDYMRLATQIGSAADLGVSIRETLKSPPPPKGKPVKDDGGMTPLDCRK